MKWVHRVRSMFEQGRQSVNFALTARMKIRTALRELWHRSPLGKRFEALRQDLHHVRCELQAQQQSALEAAETLEKQDALIADLRRSLLHLEKAHQFGLSQLLLSELVRYSPSSPVPIADKTILLASRADEVRILIASHSIAERLLLGSAVPSNFAERLNRGEISRASVGMLHDVVERIRWEDRPDLLVTLRNYEALAEYFSSLLDKKIQTASTAPDEMYQRRIETLQSNPDLIDFIAQGASDQQAPAPFNWPQSLPPFTVSAEPLKRSVLFVHNNYYHYNMLAEALRERGWNAKTLSISDPACEQQQFFHGEDINLFDPEPETMRRRVGAFFQNVPEQFGAVHFYGMGYGTLFSENVEAGDSNAKVPWDFLELRRHRLIIGNMPSGCLEGASPASIKDISGDVCSKCVWQLRPDICSEPRSAAWIAKLDLLCDWIGIEGDWQTPERRTSKHVHLPVVTALSAKNWHPDIVVPAEHLIDRQPGEILIYHAVGNYQARRSGGRDIKGTGAVLAALDRLKDEGLPVKLFFATAIPSKLAKYYQVQADIVVDQLAYGRLGANARESLMLGRPLVTSLRMAQDEIAPWISECPAAPASEETVYEVLRELVADRERRQAMMYDGREYAMRWFSSDVCAERFETIIDRIRSGLPPASDDLMPARKPSARLVESGRT